MKKLCIAALKLAVSAAILGYLFSVARNDPSFVGLWSQPKNWGILSFALVATIASVVMTFFRWQMLVNALGIDFKLRDAFRLGFLAYLFNFFSLGIIGGDVLKSVFIARQNPDKRTEAVASVFVDRVVGLFALLCVGSFAFLFVNLEQINVRDSAQLADVQWTCWATLVLTACLGAGFIMILVPGVVTAPVWNHFGRLPLVGGVLMRLIDAVRVYCEKRGLLALALGMSIGVHFLNVFGVYFVAVGLPGNEPSLAGHFVVVPIAMVASAVPLPGGLGAFEYVLDFLYRGISTVSVAPRQGFVIALGFRVVQIMIATIGLGYYLSSRREIAELIHEAEKQDDSPHDGTLTSVGQAC